MSNNLIDDHYTIDKASEVG